MFGIGMPELIIILVIILIIFGTGKLPEIGGALGKGIRNFKKHQMKNRRKLMLLRKLMIAELKLKKNLIPPTGSDCCRFTLVSVPISVIVTGR